MFGPDFWENLGMGRAHGYGKEEAGGNVMRLLIISPSSLPYLPNLLADMGLAEEEAVTVDIDATALLFLPELLAALNVLGLGNKLLILVPHSRRPRYRGGYGHGFGGMFGSPGYYGFGDGDDYGTRGR